MVTSGGTADDAVAAGLPFWALLWIAGADDNVELGEVEVFQRMLERRSWCKSALAKPDSSIPRASDSQNAHSAATSSRR